MIVSLNWLKEYIDLNGITVEEIVDKLTTSGSEIEEVIDKSEEFKNIVIGKVEEVQKHPNADKLSVCKVNDGQEIFNVVCGAPNVAKGQTVPFAKVGAVIPNGKFEIKKAKIRGEKSEGMICAEDELGLGDDHTGIMVLDNSLKIGEPLASALKFNDVILDIAITPNRADSLSHIVIARDLAALFNRKLKLPNLKTQFEIVNKSESAEVVVENQTGCPRYTAVVVKGIEVKESPEWLKEKLISIGSRPINNIVDVTNFVLHEVGQPLHAFDLDELSGSKIIVKDNGSKNKFITLDSKEREIHSTDLMICDGEKPVAIAGVMGGENSEVTNKTKNILIESAYFNPSSVRKTAKHLGLSTDASYRFERGTDPNGTLKAALRAAELIVEIAGGEIETKVIDIYPEEISKRNVSLRFDRINKILGFKIDNEKVLKILEGLEFSISEHDDKIVRVEIPTFRHDIEREIDLIEEVVRIYGFDGVPPIEKISNTLSKKIDETNFEDELRFRLTALGFNETVSNSLISDEKTMDYSRSIKVLNPQSMEMSRLRTSLIPNVLMNISRNIKVKESDLMFFEIGEVFKSENDQIKSFEDISEHENLIIALTGNKNKKTWYQKEIPFDFYDLVGLTNKSLAKVFANIKVKTQFNLESSELFEYSFSKNLGKEILGEGGKVNRELLKKYEIENNVFLFEINLSALKSFDQKSNRYYSLLKYPKVYRDFGFILDKNISYNEVVKTIKQSSSNLLKNVNLFDIFVSESLGKDKKSLAFKLEYYDESRTLREEEIDKEFWKTIEAVKTNLNAELRG